MKENFEKALSFVLKWEGGYTKHKDDPGGLTIYGISQRSYPNEVRRMNELWQKGDKKGALEIAKTIYKKNFWDRMKCDELPFPLDIIAFDTAVNMGVGAATNILQMSNKDYKDFLLLRINRYKEIALANEKLRVFFLGWVNRVMDLYKTIRGGI